jgi:hypothetical protein
VPRLVPSESYRLHPIVIHQNIFPREFNMTTFVPDPPGVLTFLCAFTLQAPTGEITDRDCGQPVAVYPLETAAATLGALSH